MMNYFKKADLQEKLSQLEQKLARHQNRANDAINFAIQLTDRMQNGTPAEKAYYAKHDAMEYIASASANSKAAEIIRKDVLVLKMRP